MHSRFSYLALFSAAALVFSGCEWGGSHQDTWNDGYSWANFTGTYRFVNALMYLPSSTSKEEGSSTTQETTTVSSEEYETVNATASTTMKTDTTTNGKVTVGDGGIVKGSFHITINGKTVSDTDNGDGTGTLKVSGTEVGKVTYATGEWEINKNGALFNTSTGAPVNIQYSHRTKKVIPPEVEPNPEPGTYPGYSQIKLSYLKVTQLGNKLTMSGDSGVVYQGRLTGASTSKNGYVAAQTVRLSFEVSASNGDTITGHFSGNWSGASDKNYGTLSDRQIHGTHSRAGNFVGTAADTTITVPTVQVSEYPTTVPVSAE